MVHEDLKGSRNIRYRDHKRWLRRLYSPAGIGLILLSCVLFHLIGHHKVRRLLGHVYTPPALSKEKLVVYTRFVTLVEAHPEYRRVYLDMWHYLRVEIHDSVKEQAVSSGGGVVDDELIRISRGLKKVNCAVAEMKGSYVLFMSRLNYILPTSPGVLYSLDGRNPNEVDDEFIKSKKPFTLIKDRWYMSRSLVLFPSRGLYTKRPLPKSLIDRSLRDPGTVSAETTTLLYQAAGTGDIKQLQSLISSGADVNVKNEYGYTPLHRAAEHGYKAVVELLIANGANVNAKDKAKQTPLHRALRWGQSNVAELLMAKGADVNAKDRNASTPLHYATSWGHYNIAKLLIATGADVDAKRENGETPLHYAARGGHVNVAELLIANGAGINAKDEDGATPIHVAARRGHTDVVKLLLATGADVNAKTKKGQTALDCAHAAGHADLVELLKASD